MTDMSFPEANGDEFGFFHPDRGYWQTIGIPSQEILDMYPGGTIEVPLKPGQYHEWENGAWVERIPALTDAEERARMPPLTARQFRLGLLNDGISPTQVTAAIDAMAAGVEKDKARIEWEYATTFNRMHPLIATIGTTLGLTDEQIDSMWAAAVSL
jgi:hypothetical protein